MTAAEFDKQCEIDKEKNVLIIKNPDQEVKDGLYGYLKGIGNLPENEVIEMWITWKEIVICFNQIKPPHGAEGCRLFIIKYLED